MTHLNVGIVEWTQVLERPTTQSYMPAWLSSRDFRLSLCAFTPQRTRDQVQ